MESELPEGLGTQRSTLAQSANTGVRGRWVPVLVLLFASCVTLGKLPTSLGLIFL